MFNDPLMESFWISTSVITNWLQSSLFPGIVNKNRCNFQAACKQPSATTTRKKKKPIFLKQLFCFSQFVSKAVFVCHNHQIITVSILNIWHGQIIEIHLKGGKQLEDLECNHTIVVAKALSITDKWFSRNDNAAIWMGTYRKDHLLSLCLKQKNWSPIKQTSVAA